MAVVQSDLLDGDRRHELHDSIVLATRNYAIGSEIKFYIDFAQETVNQLYHLQHELVLAHIITILDHRWNVL